MSLETWQDFDDHWIHHGDLGFSLDVSRIAGLAETITAMGPAMNLALAAMADLEAGACANPDEERQVGHYWLRDPDLAPDESAANLIRETVARIKSFATEVHAGRLAPAGGGRFRHVLHIGIGGSALGPQLISQVLGRGGGGCRLHFLDNTDPDGFQQVLAAIGSELGSTLTVVVSKSGGTRETHNGMLVVAAACRAAGLDFAPHAVAITGKGSILDQQAREEGWRLILPLPDWVGGRTSLTAAVGLLPLALAGGDVDAFLEGARRMDALTRRAAGCGNPAVAMALAWHAMTAGAARRSMVVLPYKDRLGLLARYLQQLIMESLGKEMDMAGNKVNQGLTVYGNKGTTDQHAYVQQLREGPDDFFVTFVQVLEDAAMPVPEVAPGATPGDFLLGFLLGTRQALGDKGRSSLLITLRRLNERSLGALIALFERAVGLYASLVNVNAYNQPGVEAGKQAAGGVMGLQESIQKALVRRAGIWLSPGDIAADAGEAGSVETAFHILRHLAANPRRGVDEEEGDRPATWRFRGTTEESR